MVTLVLGVTSISGCAPSEPAEPGTEVLDNLEQPLRFGVAEDADYRLDGWSTSNSFWTEEEPETSFGVDVCLNGVSDATITSVVPLTTVGDIEVLEPLLATISDPGERIIYYTGYPPEIADDASFVPAAGANLTFQCGDELPSQQILVGLRAESQEGGAVYGVAITYQVNGSSHELKLPLGMLMCGESTEPCGED